MKLPGWQLNRDDTYRCVQFLGSTSIYTAEIIKESAKSSWRAIASKFGKNEDEGIKALADEIVNLRGKLQTNTKLQIGLPIPNDYFCTSYMISGAEARIVSIEISLFVTYIPKLLEVIEENELYTRAATGIFLEFDENANLLISWFDNDSLEKRFVRVSI